jgi:HSP20 family protein
MYPSLARFPAGVLADFDELQRQVQRLVGARGGTSSIRAVEHGSFPAINIGVTPEAVDIYAFAPGLALGTLEVSVDKGLLTIAGERKNPSQGDGDGQARRTPYARERIEGAFRRVVSLPEDADPDRVEATYRNGVIHVHVAKREASRPRRIEIRDAH